MTEKMFTCLCLVALLLSSCSKEFQPGDVSGTWKSLHEEWTITENGESSKETFDYGDATTEYSDRFSPVSGETGRVETSMSVSLRKNKITGSNGATWVIRKMDGDFMELDYGNGAKDGEVKRLCRYVFLRVASGVTK